MRNNQQEKNRVFFDKAIWFYETWLVKKINYYLQKKLLKVIKVKPDSYVLDIGCGTGSFLETLDKEGKGVKLEGIDISGKMVEMARRRLDNRANISQRCVEDMEFKNKFDYIFTIDSFHHYADQEKAMKNLRTALKHGGKLVILDFSFGQLGNWVFKHFEPGHSRMFSREEFRKMFENNRFKEIRQRRLGIFSILTVGTE